MPSIVPGFEYDIFISYRHNDNRSGWVTDFVNALEEELASTIKEPLSTYFDKNPHDGLLETHSVDKSLEGKLNCLVFISIISQTYCDTKSFAWQHEFCAFNKLSKESQFGRDIKLSSGNVASRILSIKIHELDTEDKMIVENEIGGALRTIDFVFKMNGVNRPLQLKDDEVRVPGKILYRDQVNKVANAVKELITSIKSPKSAPTPRPESRLARPAYNGSKKAIASVLVLLMVFAGYFLFSKLNSSTGKEAEKSVAVLAFVDMSPAKDQEWFSDGLSEEILNSLAHLRELKVTARTSSFYYKGKDVPLREIADKLGVAHIVEGSVRKNGEQLRITVQLIRAKDGFHVWSNTYDRLANDIFKVQKDIAENIARTLLKELTPEKQLQLVTTKSQNIEAYEYYLQGCKVHLEKYSSSFSPEAFQEAQQFFFKSIELDPTYADAYGALADLYDTRSLTPENRMKYRNLRDSLIKIGLRLNPNSIQTLCVNGWSFLKRDKPDLDSAFYYFKKAYQLSPNTDFVIMSMAGFYAWIGLSESSAKLYERSLELDPLQNIGRNQLGNDHMSLGTFEDAKKQFKKALELDKENLTAHYQLGVIAALTDDSQGLAKQIEEVNGVQDARAANVKVQLQLFKFAMEGDEKVLKQSTKNLTLLSLLHRKKEFISLIDSISDLKINRLNPNGLARDPQYDFIRSDAEFQKIVDKVRAKYVEMTSRYGNLD